VNRKKKMAGGTDTNEIKEHFMSYQNTIWKKMER